MRSKYEQSVQLQALETLANYGVNIVSLEESEYVREDEIIVTRDGDTFVIRPKSDLVKLRVDYSLGKSKHRKKGADIFMSPDRVTVKTPIGGSTDRSGFEYRIEFKAESLEERTDSEDKTS